MEEKLTEPTWMNLQDPNFGLPKAEQAQVSTAQADITRKFIKSHY